MTPRRSPAMKPPVLPVVRWLPVAMEVLRGIGEFFSLQRWRLKQWLER